MVPKSSDGNRGARSRQREYSPLLTCPTELTRASHHLHQYIEIHTYLTATIKEDDINNIVANESVLALFSATDDGLTLTFLQRRRREGYCHQLESSYPCKFSRTLTVSSLKLIAISSNSMEDQIGIAFSNL